MHDRKPTATESIELITRMIGETRKQVEQTSHRPFLVWGYTTIAVTLAVWYGYVATHSDTIFWLWFAIPIVGWGIMRVTSNKQQQQGYVRTPIDRVLSHIWTVLGVAGLVVTLASFMRPIPVLFIIALLIGSGSTISGLILRLQAITVAGCAGIALSLLFLIVQGIDQCFIFAAVFLVMMVIPGHIMQYQQHKNRCHV